MSAKTNPEPKQPIQPVQPGERTELYSHRDLRALAVSDPRNELDELSEPHRFRKDVMKPNARLESPSGRRRGGSLLLAFLAGAAAGAVFMALTTPRTGPDLRGDLKGMARRAKRKVGGLKRGIFHMVEDLRG